MYINQTLGKWGENLACSYLEKNNYRIIEKNFRCRQGEIDIVAYDEEANEVVFFEVKTRTSFNYGFPSEAVNNMKKRHIISSVKYYLFLNKMENIFVRIDVIEIVKNNKKYKLNHIKGIL